MKQLPGLKWRSAWNSQLGAWKGCADYLGFELSDAWLFGATGAAFMLLMDDKGVGAGSSWHQLPPMRLCGNVGLAVHGVYAWRNQEDFPLKKRMAWENTQDAINRDLPCYGYCLGIPEFYVVNGYTGNGYLFSGVGTEETDDAVVLPPHLQERLAAYKEHYAKLDDEELCEQLRQLARDRNIHLQGKLRLVNGGVREIVDETGYSMKVQGPGFFEWDKLGEKHIGLLEMYWVEPMRVTDDRNIVKEALHFALEFAGAPRKWINERSAAGPAAYDRWIDNLLSPEPNGFSLSYSGQCWAECRHFAALFLEEAAERLGGNDSRTLRDAAVAYREVAGRLNAVAELIPFHGRMPEHIQEKDRIQETVDHLRAAKSAELQGLDLLRTAL